MPTVLGISCTISMRRGTLYGARCVAQNSRSSRFRARGSPPSFGTTCATSISPRTRAGAAQLADLVDTQLPPPGLGIHDLRVGRGHAKTNGAALARPVDGVGVRQRGCLGESIALHEAGAGQLLEALLHLHRQRTRPPHTGPDGAEVVLLHVLQL